MPNYQELLNKLTQGRQGGLRGGDDTEGNQDYDLQGNPMFGVGQGAEGYPSRGYGKKGASAYDLQSNVRGERTQPADLSFQEQQAPYDTNMALRGEVEQQPGGEPEGGQGKWMQLLQRLLGK